MGQEDDLRDLIEVLSQRVALLEQICLPALQSNAAKNSMASTGLVFRGVVNSVAADHGIEAARIMDMSIRPQDVCRARWAIWQRLSSVHGWTQGRIARRFDCDHTTVMHGLRQAKKLWGDLETTPPE